MSAIETRAMQYRGKVTPVGNSKGIRLDAAFFKAHPEFNGEVSATVLGDGQVLLSAATKRRGARPDRDLDPVLRGFLDFLQTQMMQHPELIEPADRAQLKRIGKLVAGVKND
jgi:prlF antitoxin for toxin YhaV_toxin